MLQPVQLEEVSARYAREIADLRDFLRKAGVATGTAQSIGDIVVRLPQDRAFHRDLTSNIWVLLHTWSGRISFSDTLGILALAAAGPQHATTSDEDDAHNLLSFLMEAHRSLLSSSQQRVATPVPVPDAAAPIEIPRPEAAAAPVIEEPSAEAVAVPAEPKQITNVAPVQDEPAPHDRAIIPTRIRPAETEQPRRRANLALAAGIAALMAAGVGMWLHSRSSSNTSSNMAPAPITNAAPAISEVSPASDAAPAGTAVTAVPPVEPTYAPPSHAIKAPLHPHSQPAAPIAHVQPHETKAAAQPYNTANVAPSRSFNPMPVPVSPPPATTAATNLPVNVAPRTTAPAAAATPVPSPNNMANGLIPRSTAKPKPPAPPVASSLLSKRLDSPIMSGDGPALGPDGRPIPQLHRRLPFAASPQETLVASAGSYKSPNGGASTPAGPPRTGIVRPTALGISAAYVIDTPTPAYPAAAVASNVQGQVRVQADVDRQGNVASAHIISGPPLLRDAALAAVQHWRYKPYYTGGKPSPISAVAVLEFELQ